MRTETERRGLERALLAFLSLLACDEAGSLRKPDAASGDRASELTADRASSGAEPLSALDRADGTEEPQPVHYPSTRCRECHRRQEEEWSRSAHSGAAREVYERVLSHVPEVERAACAGCHRPLSSAVERIAREGVTCDACHTATGTAAAVALDLHPELATKFGPYADSKDHFFHRVRFSEFVTSSNLCLACHEDRAPRSLRIFTSGTEWKRGRSAAKPCQGCHMPKFRAKACRGGDVRTVSSHTFGDRREELSRALSINVVSPGRAKHATARVEIKNATAGHALPTDLPDRRLRLVVESRKGNEVLSREERIYGRFLEDESGEPAPFFAAKRETKDTRLQEGESRQERFTTDRRATHVHVKLWYDPWDARFEVYYGPVNPILVMEKAVAVD